MQIKLNNTVVVSDPCYELNSCGQGVLKGVLLGFYNCEAKMVNDQFWGTRVASLEVCHECYAHPNYQLAPFTVGVDSGQAGVFDYEYYEKYHVNTLENMTTNDQWYDDVCDITLAPQPYGTTEDKGFVSSSGFGDGVYPCYIAKNNNGEIIAIRIVFIEE